MSCLDRSLYLNSFIGMTDDVRWVLESDGCIPERLCKLFSYNFERNSIKVSCDEPNNDVKKLGTILYPILWEAC